MSNWSKKVGAVFITRPRIATKKTVWLERKKAADRFVAALERPGAHVCLDGPTGVGKTSLVLSTIVRQSVRHVSVMCTQNMTWSEFCRQLVGRPPNGEMSLSGDFEIGVDKGLPVAKLRLSLGEKGRPIDDETIVEKLSTTWTEHDVARRLTELDIVLIVDDLELVSSALMTRLADLAKIMTQAYVSEHSKIVFVGAADVYSRLYHANKALDERVTQVSLGTFASRGDSRLFLQKGFERLDKRHPWNSSFLSERAVANLCAEHIWEAADGLPKSLNALGYDIALRAETRSGVSANDIIEVCGAHVEEHWIQYGGELGQLRDYLEGSPVAREVVRCLYEEGIGRIHRLPQLMKRAHLDGSDRLDQEALEVVLSELVSLDFIVRTGRANELLFARSPAAAHTLGVFMRAPDRFKSLPAGNKQPSSAVQLSFPLTQDATNPPEGEPSEDA